MKTKKRRKQGGTKIPYDTRGQYFIVKRNIVDYIWKSAKLEGLTVTYPDTSAIYNGMSVADVPVDEIIAVNNLKHAWQFVLDNLDYTLGYPYVCHIHRFVGGDTLIRDAGFPRKIPVRIGGTSWTPDMPIEPQIQEQLAGVLAIGSPTERAIKLMLTLCVSRYSLTVTSVWLCWRAIMS
jgi:hypothetical protein